MCAGFIGQYNAAIASMNGDVLAQQFKFLNLFAINQTFRNTIALMFFWNIFGWLKALVKSAAATAKAAANRRS